MIKHIWSVLCQKSIIDSDSNTISLQDVIERLVVGIAVPKGLNARTEKVNIGINYEIVSFWTREKDIKDEEIEVKLTILNPEGNVLNSFTNKGEFKKGIKRLRTRMKIAGLTMDIDGVYIIRVEYREIENTEFTCVAELPLEIVVNIETSPSDTSPTK